MYGGFDSNSPEAEIYLKLLETTFRKESSLMANKIQTQFEDELGRKNLGVKQAPYIVLWQTGVPSVLVELGFMSNANEELFLGDETGQLFLASAIYRAVRDYNRETAPNN
jgi:N-acetylmuramoyl-L-alanine amidase